MALVVGLVMPARAGHELAFYPSFYPQEIRIETLSPSAVVPPTSRFADGVRTWAAQDEASLDPSLLQHGAGALLGLSKQTGILIPDSSYIVVESSSQWRILEEKEKLKLKNKQVFEFEEPSAAAAVPEPGTWIALAFVFALFLARRIKSRVNPLRLT